VGAAGVGGRAVAGRLDDAEVYLRKRLQGCGPDPAPPDVEIGEIVTGEFRSPLMGGGRGVAVPYAVAYPPRTRTDARLPLVLALYGREGDYLRPLSTVLALPHHLAEGVAGGLPPFAVATVEAGPTSYWHRRASGADPQAMIAQEYLPLLGRRGLDVGRFALHGESMGGYGSLLLAQRLGARRVAAVAVDSPALFRRYSDASEVAFDSPEDFVAHDVFADVAKLAGIPVRIVCGSLDPFYDASRAFAALLSDPPAETSWSQACHTPAYWRSETPGQLRFLARHLT
jgi:enterochelin esterase-like enzyme